MKQIDSRNTDWSLGTTSIMHNTLLHFLTLLHVPVLKTLKWWRAWQGMAIRMETM